MTSRRLPYVPPREYQVTLDDGSVIERATLAGAGNGSDRGMDLALRPHDAAGIVWVNTEEIQSIVRV